MVAKDLAAMRAKYPEEFEAFLEHGDNLPDYLYRELYDMFCEEMDYGTAKGRTGDPYQWIEERLFEEFVYSSKS